MAGHEVANFDFKSLNKLGEPEAATLIEYFETKAGKI